MKCYKMLIINCFKIMVVIVVYNRLLASWFLVIQTSTAYDQIWILSYNRRHYALVICKLLFVTDTDVHICAYPVCYVLSVWSALSDCVWTCVFLCMYQLICTPVPCFCCTSTIAKSGLRSGIFCSSIRSPSCW